MTAPEIALDQPEAYIRPSALSQLDYCPGAARMQAAAWRLYGEPEESEEATTGTIGHDILRTAVLAALSEGWQRAAEIADDECQRQGLDQWSTWCVGRALGLVSEIIERYQPEVVLTEQWIPMDVMGIPRGGTADLVLICADRVVVIDYKLGYLDQGDAASHDQTAAYAAAAADYYERETAVVGLIQPRMSEPISLAEYGMEALEDAAVWAASVTSRARDPEAPLNPTIDACRYCDALWRCRAAEDAIMHAAEGIALLGDPQDPAQWGHTIDMAKTAKRFHEEAEKRAKKHLANGGTAAGFELGKPSQQRKVTDVEAALSALEEQGVDVSRCLKQSIDLRSLSREDLDTITEFIEIKEKSPAIQRARSGA